MARHERPDYTNRLDGVRARTLLAQGIDAGSPDSTEATGLPDVAEPRRLWHEKSSALSGA